MKKKGREKGENNDK